MIKKAKVKKRKTKSISIDQYSDIFKNTADAKIGEPLMLRIRLPDGPKYTPAPVLTLCGHLEDSIMLLETRISNAIAKINSLM